MKYQVKTDPQETYLGGEEWNAKLMEAYLGGWDNGVPSDRLVVGLQFEGDGWAQGSGYFSGEIEPFVLMVLKTLEVSAWHKLPGTFCRIRRDKMGRLFAMGHLLKEKWFTFADL